MLLFLLMALGLRPLLLLFFVADGVVDAAAAVFVVAAVVFYGFGGDATRAGGDGVARNATERGFSNGGCFVFCDQGIFLAVPRWWWQYLNSAPPPLPYSRAVFDYVFCFVCVCMDRFRWNKLIKQQPCPKSGTQRWDDRWSLIPLPTSSACLCVCAYVHACTRVYVLHAAIVSLALCTYNTVVYRFVFFRPSPPPTPTPTPPKKYFAQKWRGVDLWKTLLMLSLRFCFFFFRTCDQSSIFGAPALRVFMYMVCLCVCVCAHVCMVYVWCACIYEDYYVYDRTICLICMIWLYVWFVWYVYVYILYDIFMCMMYMSVRCLCLCLCYICRMCLCVLCTCLCMCLCVLACILRSWVYASIKQCFHRYRFH